MTNEIYDLPTEKDFGLEFNYEAWPHNSTVTFCNVRWNNDYRDVVRFVDQDALNVYLDDNSGPTVKMQNLTNIKWGEPIDLDIPLSVAQEFNYIKVTNPAFPVTGDKAKTYYYFIQHVQFIAGNNTRIYIQLDAWQTFAYTTVFGNCYVQGGHVGIANSNAFNNHGRDYLTVPEGMDVGSEYQIVDVFSRAIGSSGYVPADDYNTYDIMIVTTVSLEGSMLEDNPIVNSAKGSRMEGMVSGAEIYFVAREQFEVLMTVLSTRPWISQGIISITAVPEIDIYQLPVEDITILGGDSPVLAQKPSNPDSSLPNTVKVKHTMKGTWREDVKNKLPERYRGLDKLLTFPYMVLELTANTGTPLVLKPESWNDADAKVIEAVTYSPSGARLMFYPYRYNAASNGLAPIEYPGYGVFQDGGENYDLATGIFNFPQMPLVNNGYLAYMASNKNSIAFQHSSADWSQQKALMGADQAQRNAMAGVQTSGEINRLNNETSQASTALGNDTLVKHTIVGAVGGIVRGAAKDGVGGVVSGVGGALQSAVGAAIDINANNNQSGLSISNSRLTNNAANSLVSNIADSNRTLAGQVATGDYGQAIAGIQARVQDARLIQPTTSGQIGGDSFMLTNYKWGYDLKIKMLAGSALASIGEYFLRYGYSVNRFMKLPADLRCMTKFTYWKLAETYIISSKCPEEFRQTLRGIMEKGVTVWTDPNDIGQIDIADNEPLTGISY